VDISRKVNKPDLTRIKQKEEQLGNIMDRVLLNLKKAADTPTNNLKEEWESLVGEKLAKYSKIAGIKNKIAFCYVEDSTWAFELSTRYKQTILKRLQNRFGDEEITDIRFKVGFWDK